ncbi:MAG: response regulator transcription factor [Proteobacteria bacterium]|nr:response regulator transcription factor [Pseudomonadota bacterium]
MKRDEPGAGVLLEGSYGRECGDAESLEPRPAHQKVAPSVPAEISSEHECIRLACRDVCLQVENGSDGLRRTEDRDAHGLARLNLGRRPVLNASLRSQATRDAEEQEGSTHLWTVAPSRPLRYARAVAHRILIVEDDPAILRGLEMNLQVEGYATEVASDGAEALRIAEERPVDLVVLDVMIPKVNGFEVCSALRRRGSEVKIIILSAKATEFDKIMGLDQGADDYVTKPFALGELLARIKAHLRRLATPSAVRFGDVEVDLDERVVRRGGEEVSLTRREFDLLAFMVQRAGRALTRETILDAVWGFHYFGTDRTVDNFITRLRQKLDTSGKPRHFRTVRGVGYRFVPDED